MMKQVALDQARQKPKKDVTFKVYEGNGQIVVDFGKDVSWIGFLPEQAEEFATMLLNVARTAKRKVN